MAETTTAHPPIATQEEWLKARLDLLKEEKALTRAYDKLNAKRRRLPMVSVEKQYMFHGEDGDKSLLDLFHGKLQLIVYHFMFDPSWEEGCPGCTSYTNAIGDLSDLDRRNTHMVFVSRAPLEKLQAYRKKHGWDIEWYSAEGDEFNIDFGVTIDPKRDTISYNYKSDEETRSKFNTDKAEEMPGTSVFFRLGDKVYHTYSTYARGGESLTDSYRLLDVTPYGRQEDFEDSPEGWPQKPTYG